MIENIITHRSNYINAVITVKESVKSAQICLRENSDLYQKHPGFILYIINHLSFHNSFRTNKHVAGTMMIIINFIIIYPIYKQPGICSSFME